MRYNGKPLPFIILGLDFTLETVDLVHVVRLVVATVQEEAVGSQPLVGVQKQGNFTRPGASVDKITVEQVPVLVIGLSVYAEQLQEVKVLAWRHSQSS